MLNKRKICELNISNSNREHNLPKFKISRLDS